MKLCSHKTLRHICGNCVALGVSAWRNAFLADVVKGEAAEDVLLAGASGPDDREGVMRGLAAAIAMTQGYVARFEDGLVRLREKIRNDRNFASFPRVTSTRSSNCAPTSPNAGVCNQPSAVPPSERSFSSTASCRGDDRRNPAPRGRVGLSIAMRIAGVLRRRASSLAVS
jgi:hypothetical protein